MTFVPHKNSFAAYCNIFIFEIYPVAGGYDGVRCDLKYVFSRFKPVRVYRDEENEETFTCCTFSVSRFHIFLDFFEFPPFCYRLMISFYFWERTLVISSGIMLLLVRKNLRCLVIHPL